MLGKGSVFSLQRAESSGAAFRQVREALKTDEIIDTVLSVCHKLRLI